MTTIQLLADGLKGNGEMLKMCLADFSDADMVQRPCAGANHAAWQVGHLIGSEVYMVNAIRPGSMHDLPAGFSDRFNGATAKKDDAALFGSKQELLSLFDKVRQASAKVVASLSEKDLEKPGPEHMRRIVPTVGHVVLLLSSHLGMHVGQIQVIRRKLGKPVLF